MKPTYFLFALLFPLLAFAEGPSAKEASHAVECLSSENSRHFWWGLNTVDGWTFGGEAWESSGKEIIARLSGAARDPKPQATLAGEEEGEALYRKLHATVILQQMRNQGVDVGLAASDFKFLFEQYHRLLDADGGNRLDTLVETCQVFRQPSEEIDLLLAKAIKEPARISPDITWKLAAARLYAERRAQVSCAPGFRYDAGVAEEMARIYLTYSMALENKVAPEAKALLLPMLADLTRGDFQPAYHVNQMMFQEAQRLALIPNPADLCRAVVRAAGENNS